MPEALEDLFETKAWYASRDQTLQQAFVEAFSVAVEWIAQDPDLFPCVYGTVCRLVVRRFPYAVYFREVGDEIIVLAVHGRQDPRRWHSRS